MNLQEKINHTQNFSEFSETEAINLKNLASFFQDAIQTYSKLCVLAKVLFFLGIAGRNSRFFQNSLTYRDSVMVIFRFFGQMASN